MLWSWKSKEKANEIKQDGNKAAGDPLKARRDHRPSAPERQKKSSLPEVTGKTPQAAARINKRQELAMKGVKITPTVQALLKNPLPLIDPHNKLIVLFSAKSACSSVAIWFFSIIGHLKAARDYDEWPHNYRMDVYNVSALRRRALADDLASYRVVRIVRDPYDRVTSSFRHAMNTGYADAAIAAKIPEFDPKARRMSFSRFLDFVETEDLATCNMHHGLQTHPIEAVMPPAHVINITREHLFTRLNEVEEALGMPRTDFPGIAWIHDLSERREVPKAVFDGDVAMLPLTHAQATSGPWPEAHLLLTPAVRERIARLYATDVARYGNPPEAPLVRRGA